MLLLKYSRNATVLLVQIFCSLCLHGHSKQEKLTPVVLDNIYILFKTDSTISFYITSFNNKADIIMLKLPCFYCH